MAFDTGARAARGGARPCSTSRMAAAVALAVCLVGCGSAPSRTSPTSPATAGAPASASSITTVGEIAPAPAPRDLAGAAARPAEPEVPSDTTPLSARYAPRELAIPAVASGRSARFTFDGQRRGWFARLPDSRQNPLTPVYARGRVMVGGGFTSHTFYAFEARTGELDWRAAAPDGGPTAAIVEDGKALFNTESCTLFVVDVETGRQRWSRWLGDPLMSQPSAANGRVFSGHVRDGGATYGFTAMDLRTGRVLWTRDIPADVLNAAVLDATDAYFTTMDGTVWRLDQRSGRVVWRQRLDATSAPWLHGDTVHVSRRARRRNDDGSRSVIEVATVLAKRDGSIAREHDAAPAAFLPTRPDTGGVQAGWEFEGSRPTIVDGRAYQTIGNEVQARDAETGELLWRRRYTEATRARPASSPAIAGAQLVFGTRDGTLYGLDIDTGMTAWAYDVGEPIAAQPTVAHGWVYATTTRGGLVGLEVADHTLDGWHMWGGNASHSGAVVGDVAPPERDQRPTEGTLRVEPSARDRARGARPVARSATDATAATTRPGDAAAAFTLTGTRVTARVTGFVTRVTVEQTFANPFERPVEAVYLFPLPESAAVDAMELRIGNRVVRADIRRRREAREAYDDARDRGVLASLLEQERPNLFRQSVANIRPGDDVRVVLRYTQALPYEDGSYRFTYPMVAGPRYAPEPDGAESESATSGAVRQVVLASGEREDRVEVSIDADLGIATAEIASPTHAIDVTRQGDRLARVTLREAARPDRDLEVRFRVAGAAPEVAAMTSAPADGGRGHLALAIHPRLEVTEGEVTPRELVFVVDTSSSMHGRPIELARAAMITSLRGMRSSDTFRVIGFSDRVRALSESAIPATAANVARAEEFVRAMSALGATEMISGIEAALAPAGQDDRMRIVLLMTDGYIGNESEVFRAVHERLGNARVFAFGVGSAVNRYLLTRVAEEGRGDAQVVTLSEDPAHAAEAFHARIARPYLTDVSIDWGGLEISDAYPRRLPDLFADRPLVVHARYARQGSSDVIIRGRIAGRAFEQRVRVTLPGSEATTAVREELASIWARTRIGDLMTALELQPSPALESEVTELGLRHHLLTPWTAFVAIDEGYRAGGTAVRVEQPSPIPAGMEPRAEPETSTMRGARVTITPTLGAGATTASAIRAGGGGALEPSGAPLEALSASPTPSAAPRRALRRATPDRVEELERGSGSAASQRADGAARCYESARRADGSIDEEALRRCLESLGSEPHRSPARTVQEKSAEAPSRRPGSGHALVGDHRIGHRPMLRLDPRRRSPDALDPHFVEDAVEEVGVDLVPVAARTEHDRVRRGGGHRVPELA
jgi:Ca-activated chloride channel family protein